jgi:hypothetical protein
MGDIMVIITVIIMAIIMVITIDIIDTYFALFIYY